MTSELLRFEPHTLRSYALKLGRACGTAFAVACATRLSNSFAMHSTRSEDINADKHTIELVWLHLLYGELFEVCTCEADILNRLRDEDEDRSFADTVADDALSATVYALRTIKDDDVSNICWAAQRAYDLVDRYVGRSANVLEYTDAVERMITSHSVVQQELGRQQRDLEFLINSEKDGALRKLKEMVTEESTIPYP
jgi:hypothetical protein